MNQQQHSSRCIVAMIALWAGLILSCTVGFAPPNSLKLSVATNGDEYNNNANQGLKKSHAKNHFKRPVAATPASPQHKDHFLGFEQIAPAFPTGWIDRLEGYYVVLLAPNSPPRVLLRRCLADPLREGDFLWRGRPHPQRRHQMATTIRLLLQQRPPTPRVLVIP